jgi:hypothetical protein
MTYNLAVGGATIDWGVVPSCCGSTFTDQVSNFTLWNSQAKRSWTSSNSLFSIWVSDDLIKWCGRRQ